MIALATGQRVTLPTGEAGVVGWIDHDRGTCGVVVTGPSGQAVARCDVAEVTAVPLKPPWRCSPCRVEQPGAASRYKVAVGDGEAELPVCYDCLVNMQARHHGKAVRVGLVEP